MKVHARALRARLGLTQTGAAFASSCALETFRKLEKGDVDCMRIETVIRIASALEVSVADLIPRLREVDHPQVDRRVEGTKVGSGSRRTVKA